MSLFEAILAYAISWFLTLFLVLPWGVQVSEKPEKGHAASAPVNPRIGRKLWLTTLLAVIPVILLALAKNAWAEESVYHAKSSDCPPSVAYQPSGDVDVTDSLDITPADLNKNTTINVDKVQFGLDVPTANYVPNEALTDDLALSEIKLGTVEVDHTSVRLNGKPIGNSPCGN